MTFSYKGDNRLFQGKYVTTSPVEEGHKFAIFYDPEHPSRSTGLDEPIVPWVRWTAGAIGIVLAVIAISLWGNEEWFNN